MHAAFRAILGLFFLWGFLTCLNDILVPHLRSAFALSYASVVLIPVAFFTTCFVFAPVASVIIQRLGFLQTMIVGLLTMGIGSLSFLVAAETARFEYFLVALSILGAGITVLQAAAAPYVAFLGPPETSSSRFSLALGFNSLGTFVAQLSGGWFILSAPADISVANASFVPSLAERMSAMSTIRGPYLFLGCTLLLLAAAVALSGLPRIRTAPQRPVEESPVKSVFKHRPLVYGALTVFLYAGAEVGIGSLLVNYLSLRAVLGISHHAAALLGSIYWGGAVVGRFCGWRLLQRFRGESVLVFAGSSAGILVAVSVTFHGILAAAAILLTGLCNSLIVPIVVMFAISGLGPLTGQASSVTTSANIGAGLVPLAIGVLADHVGLHHALALTLICYGFVVYYALRGSKGHLLHQGRVGAKEELADCY